MTVTSEESLRRGDLTKTTSRDAEASVSSTTTQTRFSFYNAEDYSTREEPNPNRFNFYNEELQRQIASQTTLPMENPLPQVPEERTAMNDLKNNPDSIEILRSLQHYEQQRLTILDNHADESVEVSTEKSNPYEDAIKEALALLKKHRDPSSSNSSVEGHLSSSFSSSFQSRPTAIETNQIHTIEHGVDEILLHAIQTDLRESSQASAPIFDGAFYPSTPSDVMTPGSNSALGDAYQAEIEARRRQRQERMAKYSTRLAELKQETGTVASSSSHHDRIDDEIECLGLATSTPAFELSASNRVHRIPSQPIVAFSSNQIPHVASGLTTSSRIDDFHQQQVQLGVERVLLAILDRANSGGRGQQQLQSLPSGWRQEEKKSFSDELEPVVQQHEKDDADPLVQAMSELLQIPASIVGDDTTLMGKAEEMKQTLALDSLGEANLESNVVVSKTSSVIIPQKVKTFPSELRLSHSDPGPDAHAELDRMVEEVLKKNSESCDSYGSSDMYDPDPINQRVRQILTASSTEASVSKPQDESENILRDDEDSNLHDLAGHNDSIEDGVDADTDLESLCEDDANSESDTDNPTVPNGVLGPLSVFAGGTTGVVLESDSSEDAPSLFDSISAAARNFVAGVSSSSESEAAYSGVKSSLSHKKEWSQTYELMQTLFAHLILTEFPRTKKKLNDRIPSWDESNPDEVGYRVIRLTLKQLEQVEDEYELEMRSRRKEVEKFGDESLEDDLKQAQDQLEIEERQTANGGENGCFSANEWSKDFKESECLQEFPGIKPTGRGEMGDLEFFSLPIIFKSHVTGFEPTKDIYLDAGNIVAGQYLVEGEMGSAAFSTAYRCIDLNSVGDGPDGHEEVCLKVIKNTKDFFDQSLDEIKILELLRQTGMCDQKNILKMKTFFYHREHLIIVTELLRQNLFEFGKFITDNDEEPYFTISRLSYITRQCLVALDFVHKIGLVHSDIKPENILLASYSRAKVKVIDFGSSCYLTDRQSSYIQSRSYRAPEVVLGLPYDGRIDIWSLGCVVAEMYTGEVTFQNDSVVSMLSRIEAICGPIPKRMIRQGRQSGTFYTSSCLLYEKVKKSRKDSDDSLSGDDKSLDGSDTESDHVDIFQPKKTSLAARLGFAADLMLDYDDGKHLSREQKKQAIFVDFVRSLLTVDPDRRLTAEEALKHPWMEYAATLTEADIKYP